MAGSTYIFHDILRDPKKRKDSVYHHVMLGVAGSDFMHAMTNFLGTWPMPKELQMFAVGSEGMCAAVGFFNTLSFLLSPYYNCSLATYYLLLLKYTWNDQRMKAFEKWLHIVPWALSLVGPLILVFNKRLGPASFTCSHSIINTTTIDTVMTLIGGCSFALTIVFVMVVMFMVYKHIRDIEIKASSFTFSFYSGSSQTSERKRSRRVMIQGLMYAGAMLLAFIPWIVIVGLSMTGNGTYFNELLVHIIFPLQGLFNAFIYSGKLQRWFYVSNGQWRCYCCTAKNGESNFNNHDGQENNVESSRKPNTIVQTSLSGTKVSKLNSAVSGTSMGMERLESCDSKQSLTHPSRVTKKSTVISKDCINDVVGHESSNVEIMHSQHSNSDDANEIYDDNNEEEKEEITAQFPIFVPQSPSLRNDDVVLGGMAIVK